MKVFLISALFLFLSACQLNRPEVIDSRNSDFDPRSRSTKTCLPETTYAYMRTQAVNIDPARIIIHMDNQIAMTAFGQLVGLDEYENVRPYLAKKWEISSDGLVYTFILDDSFRFSNGKSVTAEDVVFSINRLFSKDLESRIANFIFGESLLGIEAFKKGRSPSIDGVREINSHTVQLILKEPRSILLARLADGGGSIIPKEMKFHPLAATEIVSAGPFQVKSFSNDRVVLERNKYFPKFFGINTLVFEHPHEELCEVLKSKRFDFIDAGPIDTPLCDHPDYDRIQYEGGNLWFIAFGKNVSATLRRDIISCSDKSDYLLAMKSMNTTSKSLDRLFPNLDTGSSVPISKLQKVLKRCHISPKRELKLLVNQRHHYSNELLSIFKSISGLKVRIEVIDDTRYHSARELGDYDLMLIEFSVPFSDLPYRSSIFSSNRSIISNGYHNALYDQWDLRLAKAANEEERVLAARELENIFKSDPPAIFLKQHENVEWARKSLMARRTGLWVRCFYALGSNKDQESCPE